MTIDLVSGAEVPPLGPTPAMITAGAEVLDDELGPAGPYHDRIARLVWRAMEHARITAQYNALNPKCPSCGRRGRHLPGCDEVGSPDDSFRPPGYRNASEDEPERDAGMRQSEP